VDRIAFTKIATVLAISTGVAFGLCGLGLMASGGGEAQGFPGRLFTLVFQGGLIAFGLSFLGLVLLLLLWIALALVKAVSGR